MKDRRPSEGPSNAGVAAGPTVRSEFRRTRCDKQTRVPPVCDDGKFWSDGPLPLCIAEPVDVVANYPNHGVLAHRS